MPRSVVRAPVPGPVVHRGNKKIYREHNLNIEGNGCTVYGNGCNVKGHGNEILGNDCTADGTRNKMKGFGARCTGPRNIIYQHDCIEIDGMGNIHKVETTPEAIQRKSQFLHTFLRNAVLAAPITRRNPGPPPAPLPVPQGEDEHTDDPNKQCVVCLDNAKCCAFTPCHHLCVCISCSTKLNDRKCPMCRRTFTKVDRIFT
jgi:hypothetical protein